MRAVCQIRRIAWQLQYLWLFCLLGMLPTHVRGQCQVCSPREYASAQGEPPTACWNYEQVLTSRQLLASGNALQLSTAVGGIAEHTASSVAPFYWHDGQAFETRMRVTSGSSGFLPGYRAAAFVVGVDAASRIVSIHIEPSRVALSTNSNVNAGAGTALYNLDTASGFRTYRVQTDAAGAKLFIDGVERLSVPYTDQDNRFANSFAWGNDARFSWASTSEWQRVVLEQAPTDCDNCGERSYFTSQGAPEAACWSYFAGTGSTANLVGQSLQLVSTSGTLDFARSTPPFSWRDGHKMEARLRVTSGGSGYFPGYRAAAFFSATDQNNQGIVVFIEPTRIALSTDQNASAGPGTALLSFDAASAFHDYAVVTDNLGARLSIDGIERLTVPYASTHPTISNYVNWGHDARFGWTSASQWQSFNLTLIPAPTSVATCPQRAATFSIAGAVASDGCAQWQFENASGGWSDLSDGVTNLGEVSGATTQTLLINSPHPGITARVRAVLTRSCGLTPSKAATLSVSQCDCIDFNDDNLFPDDADLVEFLTVLAGGECTTGMCNDIDFNNDGLFPDDNDLVAFLMVLAGGKC